MMKKVFVTLLSMLLILSSTACGGGNSTAPADQLSPGQASLSPGEANPAEVSLPMGEISGEITVSVFDPMSYKYFLEEAAALFEEKYPGTKVNIEAFSSMPEIKTAEMGDGKMVAMISSGDDKEAQRPDYINKISTELMSGGGADILAADVIPYYQYAMGGQIEDLSPYIAADPDFDPADYRSNILDAIKINGKQYILPMDYTFNLVAYQPDLFRSEQLDILKQSDSMTYEEMISLSASGFDSSSSDSLLFAASGGSGGGSMFDDMFKANYSEFIDIENKTANFTSGAFADLLETVRDYEE